MFTVECDSCRASYELDERRVPDGGMRMRCPKCGASFVVDKPVVGTADTHTLVTGGRVPAVPTVGPGARAEPSEIIDLPGLKAPPVPNLPMPVPPLPRGTLVGARASDPQPSTRSALPGGPAHAGAFGTMLGPRTLQGAPVVSEPPRGFDFPEVASTSATAPGGHGILDAPPFAPDTDPDADRDLSVSNIRIDDLPDPDREVDLPAPQPEALFRKDIVDLPAIKGTVEAAELPAPRGDLLMPKPGGGPRELDFGAPRTDIPLASAPARATAQGLPLPKAVASGFGDLDLPGFRAELPTAKAELPATRAELPTAKAEFPLSGAELPAAKHEAPGFGDRDLPELPELPELPVLKPPAERTTIGEAHSAPKLPEDLPALKGWPARATVDESNFGGLELPDLPAPVASARDEMDFSDLDLPPPKPDAGLVPSKEKTFRGVADGHAAVGGDDDSDLPPSLRGEDETSFGDLNFDEQPGRVKPPPAPTLVDRGPPSFARGAREQIDPDDSMLDAMPPDDDGEPIDAEADALDADASGDEIGSPPGERAGSEDMEFGIGGEGEETEGGTFSLPPEILRRQRGEQFDAKEAQLRKRALRLLMYLGVVLMLGASAGVGVGYFTSYGMFGIYLIEQWLPDYGDNQFALREIDKAEKIASTDAYRDVRRGLEELGRARGQMGLNRLLLTRSVVHHALYIMRFGEDAASASRIAAIMRRLEERSLDAEGIELALAADAARRRSWGEVGPHLSRARSEARSGDPYIDLVAAEVALAQGQLEEAEKAFQAALAAGAGVRAQWGLARIARFGADLEKQIATVEETLRASPLHVEARIADARIKYGQEREEKALELLQIALGILPTEDDQKLRASKQATAMGYGMLGYIHESRGRTHQARKAYEAALTADPYSVEPLLGAARVLFREERYADANARFDQALTIATKGGANPQVMSGRKADAEAKLGIARTLVHLEKAQEARAKLMELAAELPNDAEVVVALGETERGLGNHEVAETSFRKAIEVAPGDFQGYLALAQLYLGQNEQEKASEILNQATLRVEETPAMRIMLGQASLQRNMVDGAVHEFERALELDRHSVEATYGLAVALRRSGELDRARSLFDKIAKKDPGYGGLVKETGLVAEAQGDFAHAIKIYEGALEENERNTDLLLRLGAAQLAAGQLDLAEQTLAKVIRETPNSAEAEYFIGRVDFARGRSPDALTHFTRAVSLDGTKAEYHLYIARASLVMQNLQRTLEGVETALELDPELGDAYWVRADLSARGGHVKDALRDVKRALQLNPARTEAYVVRAEAYDQLGERDKAIAALRTAIDREPKMGEWRFKLGRQYMLAGNLADAKTELRHAMDFGDAADPMPYWLPEAYRMAGDLATDSGSRGTAIKLYLRYLEIAPEAEETDRKAVQRQLREWDVDLGEEKW